MILTHNYFHKVKLQSCRKLFSHKFMEKLYFEISLLLFVILVEETNSSQLYSYTYF